MTLRPRRYFVSWGTLVASAAGSTAALLLVAGLLSATTRGGFWAPAVGTAGLLARTPGAYPTPVPFDLAGVVLGVFVAGALSLGLLLPFGVLAPRFATTPAGLLAAGLAYGLAVFLTMWYVAFPLLEPQALEMGALAAAGGYATWGLAGAAVIAPGARFR